MADAPALELAPQGVWVQIPPSAPKKYDYAKNCPQFSGAAY